VINLRRVEAAEMFGGHPPSRGALNVVQEAMRFGMNPTPYVEATVKTAEKNGRRKIIVKPGNPLGILRDAVISKQATGR